MSKKPTPKYKLCKSRGKRRYQSFQTKTRKRLTNITNLVKCPSCGAKVVSHTARGKCGKYRGRQVLDIEKEMKKITKVKA